MAGTLITISSRASGNVESSPGTLGEPSLTRLYPPITLDPAKRYTVSIVSASTSYSSPNISAAAQNNAIVIDYSDGSTHAILMPDGLYTPSDIADYVNIQLRIIGLSPGGQVLSFSVNSYDQSLNVVFYQAGFRIAFGGAVNPTETGNLAQLLGVASPSTVPPAGYSTVGMVVALDYRADFTQGVTEYAFHSSLVAGSYIGGAAGDVLCLVPLATAASAGAAVTYTPPYKTPLRLAPSGIITEVSSYITDQSGRRVSLEGEPWTYTVLLEAVRD